MNCHIAKACQWDSAAKKCLAIVAGEKAPTEPKSAPAITGARPRAQTCDQNASEFQCVGYDACAWAGGRCMVKDAPFRMFEGRPPPENGVTLVVSPAMLAAIVAGVLLVGGVIAR